MVRNTCTEKSISRNHAKKGLSQKDIAKKLELGKSAVSQYIKGQRGTELKFDKKMIKKIEQSADMILKNKSTIKEELVGLCDFIRKEGLLCCFHKSMDKKLKECEVCLR